MKRTPDLQRLEDMLRSSRLVVGGFLGSDRRGLEEIIDADAAELERLGHSAKEVAARMQHITLMARRGLGNTVTVAENLDASTEDARGMIVCPWPHKRRRLKTVTTVRRRDTGQTARWSDLSIHLIGEHGFFEGRGSTFRLEPRELVGILF